MHPALRSKLQASPRQICSSCAALQLCPSADHSSLSTSMSAGLAVCMPRRARSVGNGIFSRLRAHNHDVSRCPNQCIICFAGDIMTPPPRTVHPLIASCQSGTDETVHLHHSWSRPTTYYCLFPGQAKCQAFENLCKTRVPHSRSTLALPFSRRQLRRPAHRHTPSTILRQLTATPVRGI